ncbi:MAG TPA: DOMON-like domain-containing protein [Burkholderiales bacterium]|nr:DOMON-like domain-containing protein [Burkholderiales bacterium]
MSEALYEFGPPVDVSLFAYPSTPCEAVRGIDARVQRLHDGLRLRFVLHGRLHALSVPAAQAPARTDELWRHTCFEAFVAPNADPAYYEVNLSPSREWAIYRFDRYREGMEVVYDARPALTLVKRTDDRLEVDADVDLGNVAPYDKSTWRVGLSAVVEDVQGAMSYWALAHPAAKPDFHHRDGFVVELAPVAI